MGRSTLDIDTGAAIHEASEMGINIIWFPGVKLAGFSTCNYAALTPSMIANSLALPITQHSKHYASTMTSAPSATGVLWNLPRWQRGYRR